MEIMKKKLSLVLATAMTLGLVLSGCGGGNTSGGGGEAGTEPVPGAGAETTEAAAAGDPAVDTTGFMMDVLNADIQTADVQKTSKDYTMPQNIYDRLLDIEVDDAGVSKIVPSLAEDWDISGDGLEYTFHLRQGVKFHNGNDFTAEDVVYTFNRLLTVENGVNTELLDQVKGAAELIEGSADTLEGVEQIDDYKIGRASCRERV